MGQSDLIRWVMGEVSFTQNLSVEVIRGHVGTCTVCGNSRRQDACCEYCGNNAKLPFEESADEKV